MNIKENALNTTTLENGIRIIHLHAHTSVSYCGVAINVGARDELEDEHGMAHFVEHMLFKGTKKRKAFSIANRMESVGGDINAYTSKEETFVYTAFLPEYTDRAVELLSDILFCSQYPDSQFDMERTVIKDEINSYMDNPSEMIYDEFENILFENHQLGHFILGKEKDLDMHSPDKMKKFVDRFYRPDNMILFYHGDTSFKKVMRYANKYFGKRESSNTKLNRSAPSSISPKIIIEKRDTAQQHVIMGAKSYSMSHKKRYALAILNNVLGGPYLTSRLSSSLREQRGYVYNIESNAVYYSDTGLIYIYFGCDRQYSERCLKLIEKELKQLRNTSLTSTQLERSKKQLKGQIGISSNNLESEVLTMAKSFLHFNKSPSIEEVFSKIEKVDSKMVLEVANELLDSRFFSQIVYG